MDKTIYPFSFDNAQHRGEQDLYNESAKLNRACVKAIDQGVKAGNYELYRYKFDDAIKTLAAEYGFDRINWVLAGVIRDNPHDGRYSDDNRVWARGIHTPREQYPDFVFDTHPAVLDGFIGAVRKAHTAVLAEAVGQYETAHHMADRNRLTWFHGDMGAFVPNPGVTQHQLSERVEAIMEKKMEREQVRIDAVSPETVGGYEVKQAVCFSNDRGFALAENPRAAQPFVTWQFTDEDGKKDMYWGHYFTKEESAVKDFGKRVSGYQADYPTLTVKYGHAAEASRPDAREETKPSLLGKLDRAKADAPPRTPPERSGKNGPER